MNHDAFRPIPFGPEKKLMQLNAFNDLINMMRISYMQEQLETVMPIDANKETSGNVAIEHSVIYRIEHYSQEHSQQLWQVTLIDANKQVINPVAGEPLPGITVELEQLDNVSERRKIYIYNQEKNKTTAMVYKPNGDAVVIDSVNPDDMVNLCADITEFGTPVSGDDITESFNEVLNKQPEKAGKVRALAKKAIHYFSLHVARR